MIEILFLLMVLWMAKTPAKGLEWMPKEQEEDAWKFDSVEDCMEFRDLRATGWKGNAQDFYRWKEEE